LPKLLDRVGLTFDDVLLVPRRSSVRSRREVSTRSRFTRRIWLEVPVVSAAMDTVTEAEMAVAMAREGGIGVVHRFNTVAQQVEHIKAVKRAENIAIDEPYTVGPDATIAEAEELMERKKRQRPPSHKPRQKTPRHTHPAATYSSDRGRQR
jgi:IMP dehydrogenase